MKLPLREQIYAAFFAIIIAGLSQLTIPLGLPVFAGGASGIGVLFGPTGGYLIGFIFNGLLTGKLLETGRAGYVRGMLANIAGALATLFFGTLWLKWSTAMSWTAAINGGFVLFLLPGVIKAIAAAYLGIFLRKRLQR